MIKNILKLFGVVILAIGAYYVWFTHFNYVFTEISENKVYKSGFIKDRDKLESILVGHNIKTVIDLMNPVTKDQLNPGQQDDIDIENDNINAINEKNNLNIKHINIPSNQVPSKQTLTKFFKVLDDEASYPVLIHCYHGTGRAQMYSALYRIEYENWSNKDARAKTRFIVEGLGYRSSFSDGKEKGDFLMNYKPRSMGENSTLNKLDK